MSKRTWSLLLTGVLLASLFQFGTASAAAPEVPEEPNIVDPQGDANHHSWATGVGSGPYLTGADILAIWFTHDTDNLYMHIQTSTGARPDSLTFVTYVDPGVGDDCLQLRLTTEGELNDAFTSINRSGDCGGGTEEAGEVIEDVGPEDTAILTGVFPRSAGDEFADGNTLAGPNALVGHNAHAVSPRVGIIDDTEVGTDYEIRSEESGQEPGTGPTEPKDPPKKKKKKNCKKIKNKKKKKKCKKQNKKNKDEGPQELSCETFVPGKEGAEEAEVLKVEDTHTEEEPLVIEYEHGMAGPNEAGLNEELFFNIQSYSDQESTGLNILQEFDDDSDLDLYLYDGAGEEVDSSGAFNPAPVPGVFDSGGSGGMGYESISGVETPQCTGYTIRSNAYLTPGTPATLSIWLGGAAAEDEAAAAVRGFFSG